MPTWTASGGTTFDGRKVVGTDKLAEDLRTDLGLLELTGHVSVMILAPESANLDLENASIVDLWFRQKAARRGQTSTCDTHVEPLVIANGPPPVDDPRLLY